MYFRSMLAGAVLLQVSMASNYLLVDDYSGNNFFNKMYFFTGGDPTHGFVNYVNQATAQAGGLINTNNGVVYMGVDHTNVASNAGRNSIRVVSNRAYTHMLVVADIGNMPGGVCGTWPAFWSVGGNWPYNGEIDIIEGVHDQSANYMTLHSSPNCAVTNGGVGILQPYSQDCNTQVNGNEGCSFHETNSVSYGAGMNANGGAQYAMEWTSAGVKVWWWNRNNPPPGDMFGANPNPANWGRPSANWAGSGCSWDAHFAQHQLVFDTTFCGDWAGAVWGNDPGCSSKASSCQAFVQNNPGAFAPVYWSIKALKVYQNNGQNNAKREGEGDAEADATEFSERTAEPEPVAKAEAAPEPTPFVAAAEQMGKRAYGSQVAPSSVAKASQTVNSVSASVAASKEATSLGLPPPSPVPKTSMAANQQRDVIGESRRARYMPRNVQA